MIKKRIKNRGQCHIHPFYMIKTPFEIFLRKKHILGMGMYIRMKSIPWETLHVCETLKLLLSFRHLSIFFWKIRMWWRKMPFIFVSRGEKLIEYWKFIPEFFLQDIVLFFRILVNSHGLFSVELSFKSDIGCNKILVHKSHHQIIPWFFFRKRVRH